MKSGNEPGATPKEEPKPKPKRDAAYLRVLFGITASARVKANDPNAVEVWVDGNLAKHRAEWRHLWGDKPFPFDKWQGQFKSAVGHYSEDKLPAAIEAICKQMEETWNAE